jgi:hypothetical protein
MDQAAGNVKRCDRKDDRQGGCSGQPRQQALVSREVSKRNVIYNSARSDCTRTIRRASDSFFQ